MTQDIFRLVLTDEAQNFIESLSEAVSYKIYYNIKRVVGGERNKELFKKLENSEIWEFRTLYNKTAYRLFAFWDKDKETLVIATHGIIKKTQKTPSKEIAKRLANIVLIRPLQYVFSRTILLLLGKCVVSKYAVNEKTPPVPMNWGRDA